MPQIDPTQVRVLQERAAGQRPRLRGVVHLVALILTCAGAVPFVLAADSGRAQLGAALFVGSAIVLFGTSAAYHRLTWSPAGALRMKRADHVAILVLVAGTYSPVALVVLDGWLRPTVLAIGWGAVLVGAVVAALGAFEVRGVAISTYIALGWLALAMAPALLDQLGAGTLVLIAAGGVVYTLGAVGLACRWPDPDPAVFGFHEVWHLATVVAAALHAAAIHQVVS